MTHCPFGGGLKKIFLLASALSMVVLLSVLDWGSYNREHSISSAEIYTIDYLGNVVISGLWSIFGLVPTWNIQGPRKKYANLVKQDRGSARQNS